jgi:hypothetical protein
MDVSRWLLPINIQTYSNTVKGCSVEHDIQAHFCSDCGRLVCLALNTAEKISKAVSPFYINETKVNYQYSESSQVPGQS